MASSLIAVLDAHATKTPDEIVEAITDQNILFFCTLTEEEAQAFHDKVGNRSCLLFAYHEGRWIVYDDDWDFWAVGEVDYFREYYWRMACIAYEDYTDGRLPHRVPERQPDTYS